MGLLEKLQGEGSKFTYTADGLNATPYLNTFNAAPGGISTNILATNGSLLHGQTGNPGYSLNGDNESAVTAEWNEYKDGDPNNTLPESTELDPSPEDLITYQQSDPSLSNAPGFN